MCYKFLCLKCIYIDNVWIAKGQIREHLLCLLSGFIMICISTIKRNKNKAETRCQEGADPAPELVGPPVSASESDHRSARLCNNVGDGIGSNRKRDGSGSVRILTVD